MEITKINPRGYSSTVIFTGTAYYFISDYCGLFAVAERVNIRENIGTEKQDFALVYGSEHLNGGSLGGSQAASVAKAFIRKAEQRYLPQTVNFISEKYEDLSRKAVKISVV